ELLPRLSSLTGRARSSSRRYISVALVRGSPLAGVTRYPCPVEPGLSSRTGFRLMPAAVRPARALFYTIQNPASTKMLYLRRQRDIISMANHQGQPCEVKEYDPSRICGLPARQARGRPWNRREQHAAD